MVLVAAHCVSDSPKQSISVVASKEGDNAASASLAAENVIIHPEYNGTEPSGQHDLAVVKVKQSDDDHDYYACLPEVGDDPMDGCQGCVQQFPPSSQYAFECCNLPQLLEHSEKCTLSSQFAFQSSMLRCSKWVSNWE